MWIQSDCLHSRICIRGIFCNASLAPALRNVVIIPKKSCPTQCLEHYSNSHPAIVLEFYYCKTFSVMQQIIFQYVCSSKVVPGEQCLVCRFSRIWINSPTHRVYSLRTEKLDEIASNFLQHLFNFRDWSLTMQSLIPSSKVEGFKLLLAKIAAAQVKCSYLNWVIEKKRSIRQKSIAEGQICRN